MGNFTHCDNSWGKGETPSPCYKIYYVTGGRGDIVLDSQHYILLPGHLYFISASEFEGAWCDDFMDVYWYHFATASLLLYICLRKCEPFFVFKKKTLDRWRLVLEQIPCLLTSQQITGKSFLYGMHLSLLGNVLEGNDIDSVRLAGEVQLFSSAIEFMDTYWMDNPPLEEIAKLADLTPNHFHNVFKKSFMITPYKYMLRKRMVFAKELLLSTNLSIKQIAARSGYACPYHFSKIYKKYYGISPKRQKDYLLP